MAKEDNYSCYCKDTESDPLPLCKLDQFWLVTWGILAVLPVLDLYAYLLGLENEEVHYKLAESARYCKA